ncbi:uncharacterized protein LOC107981521 [Nasonia vitripennis]|uniref:Uncharacterized protein n=1 Tax=Nasonia vitripennis TaxID=7425 RepID=A0A7M7Q150_NASVI|nr:uncharacterized protein LOC107981521 [Nasonia vitripennis]
MLLKFSIANTLSMTGISNLFKLINLVCGSAVVPQTRYKIDKLFDDDIITLHGVCPACTNYIGTFQDFNYVVNCANCDKPVNMSNPSSQCYFAIFDPSNAIQDYIETNENYYDYVVKEREHEKNHIKDIYDGVLYRKFVQSLKDSDRHSYATVIFNTDGAPVFESSTYSIWPIYLILNEIPIQSRMKSAITAGLWFGKDKPIMSVFLDAFVNMINDLSTVGVGIPCMIKNERRNLKIFALVASVDTVARAPMNGSSQFNARYGCDWCTHKGQYFQGSMRYPFRIPLPKNRDHDTTIKHAAEAVETGKRVFGIVTASPLLNLKKFDIIEGFTPDYMHCYVAGVAKQFTTYILRHLRKADIQYINQLLEAIRAPHQIGRLTRSLKNRKYWKAREYENWLLYYSIPVLSAVLDNARILKHWALLVDALHICLGTNITYTELNRANEMLHEFVSKAEDLYSLTSLTYNVHQLLHLPTSVYNWGPLYSHSTYPFESANCKLLQAIHCAKGVILQIARYDKIQRAIQMLSNSIYPTCHESVVQYCENVKTPLGKNIYKISSINYLGKGKSANNETLEKFGISKDARVFHKIIYKGCLFMTSKKKKMLDHAITLHNLTLGNT